MDVEHVDDHIIYLTSDRTDVFTGAGKNLARDTVNLQQIYSQIPVNLRYHQRKLKYTINY